MNYEKIWALQWYHDGGWDWVLENWWDSEGNISVFSHIKRAEYRLRKTQKRLPECILRIHEIQFTDNVDDNNDFQETLNRLKYGRDLCSKEINDKLTDGFEKGSKEMIRLFNRSKAFGKTIKELEEIIGMYE